MFEKIITFISVWAIPFLLFIIPILAIKNKVKVYEVFIDGAKGGFEVAIKIIPYLVAILVAIGMFRASGAMDIFVRIISPFTDLIGMPAEALPAALMRPLSGSGTLGIATEVMKEHGPDSFIGRLVSTFFGVYLQSRIWKLKNLPGIGYSQRMKVFSLAEKVLFAGFSIYVLSQQKEVAIQE